MYEDTEMNDSCSQFGLLCSISQSHTTNHIKGVLVVFLIILVLAVIQFNRNLYFYFIHSMVIQKQAKNSTAVDKIEAAESDLVVTVPDRKLVQKRPVFTREFEMSTDEVRADISPQILTTRVTYVATCSST